MKILCNIFNNIRILSYKMQCDIAPQYWKIIKRGMRDVMLGDGTGKNNTTPKIC